MDNLWWLLAGVALSIPVGVLTNLYVQPAFARYMETRSTVSRTKSRLAAVEEYRVRTKLREDEVARDAFMFRRRSTLTAFQTMAVLFLLISLSTENVETWLGKGIGLFAGVLSVACLLASLLSMIAASRHAYALYDFPTYEEELRERFGDDFLTEAKSASQSSAQPPRRSRQRPTFPLKGI